MLCKKPLKVSERKILMVFTGESDLGDRYLKVTRRRDSEFVKWTRTKKWDAPSISVAKRRLESINYNKVWVFSHGFAARTQVSQKTWPKSQNGKREDSNQHCRHWTLRFRQVHRYWPSDLRMWWYWQKNNQKI